ncbi:MAG TPA: glycosyltransferase family 1 protein [Polyangiaceae bacterium]|nr:glycosyltransferase family 1 protein [Polyangiaceae bacterium]
MFDLVCFSHLRWDFVFQRPQHLLSRAARSRRVFYVEEPHFAADEPKLEVRQDEHGVHVVTMHLPDGLTDDEALSCQRVLLQHLVASAEIADHVQWFYTPMALPLAQALPKPLACVYDCMDELSAFKGAPPRLCALESELLRCADLVFTGGHALFEAKRELHHNIHPFPSSVDREHFARARVPQADPPDQAPLPRPRLGFFGVIDERMDLVLLEQVARLRPDWQLVMIGPVVKIDERELPRLPNIHYLGAKSYAELPNYLAGWDVALMPFAKNEATRFISPTKTPEYLAAGKPVVSTSIRDVVRPYSVRGLAHIADTPLDFVAACSACLADEGERFLRRVDAFLSHLSWDQTWSEMEALMERVVESASRSSGEQPCADFEEAREVG